jgi:outer membrane protein assembly factor BamD (BamD/ComL family)
MQTPLSARTIQSPFIPTLFLSLSPLQESVSMSGIDFTDQSDRDFDYKELMAEVKGKASVGHWKAATRKLKKLRRAFPANVVTEEVYLAALKACAADR